MTIISIEQILLTILNVDKEKISTESFYWTTEFATHNECELAYDVLLFDWENRHYHPSIEAKRLIKLAAEKLQLQPPSFPDCL